LCWMHLGKRIRLWRGWLHPSPPRLEGEGAYSKGGTALLFQELFLKKIGQKVEY
jgi:hypothetical protein